MTEDDTRRHLFDKPRNVRLVIRGLILACAVLFGLDGLLHRHVSHPWEGFFGFYALYGFVACVLLVLLAKEMRKLVMRDESYYERPRAASSGHRRCNPAEGSEDG
jgi:hypothetical protein